MRSLCCGGGAGVPGSVPLRRDPEVASHSTAARDEPAGLRHAVAQDAVITQCGLPMLALRL
jgi:hypothetical protein